MPQQLIYTSAPQGVDAGRSGYCTVARSSTMGDSLVQRLEQFSYYERLSEHGGEAERIVFVFRNIDIRGKAYHVLSRIKDAPPDYTGRTNFIAQHLVFTPDEVSSLPTPPVIFNHWSGWKDHWEQEPGLLENESWVELDDLIKHTFLPAKNWFSETADHGRAAGLLGLNAGILTAHDFKPKLILDLISESLELLQLEGPNWRSLAWQRTFSVGCQPQDNPADFRWRFLTSGLPFESSANQGRAPAELRRLRAPSNPQQVQFAQKGATPPQFTNLPRPGEAVQINEGETLRLDGEAISLPGPSIYRWYRVEKDNVTLEEVEGAHEAALVIHNPQRGKLRYKVRAWDSVTHKYAESLLIVVEVNAKTAIPILSAQSASTSSPAPPSNRISKAKNEKQAKLELSNSQTKRYTPGVEPKLNAPESVNFLTRHKSGVLAFGCLSLFLVLCHIILSNLDFWKPCFSGIDGKNDWWHLKILQNIEHFQKHPRLTDENRDRINNYLNGKKNNLTGLHRPEEIIKQIMNDLENYSATNKVRPVRDKPQNDPPPPPPPKDIKADRADVPSAALQANQTDSKIYTILDIESLDKLISAVEKQTPKTVSKEKEKKNEQSDRMLKRKNQAASIQYPESFKTTNGNPGLTLRWALLGESPSAANTISGEWRTNNQWTFKTDKWALTLSSTSALFRVINPPGPIQADISLSNDAGGNNERLRLLLFKPIDSQCFQASIIGDSLIPSPKLQEFLNNLDLRNNQLRLYGTYANVKNAMDYKITEIRNSASWKLGIQGILSAYAKDAENLESIKTALDQLEILWRSVKTSTGAQLHESEFSKAIDDDSPKKAFWKQLNRLCVVAIHERAVQDKGLQLEENPSGEDAWKVIEAEIAKSGNDNSKFRGQLKILTNNFSHYRDFWKLYTEKSYTVNRKTLLKDIQDLRNCGETIDPSKLDVSLQLQVFGTNWVTITRLNCQ